MEWQVTWFTVPLALIVLLTLGVIVPVYRNRDQRAAVPLLVTMLFAALYGISVAIQLSATTLETKLFWNSVAQIGRAGVPIAIFLLAAAYTDRRQWFGRGRLAVLAAIGATQFTVPWLNPNNIIYETVEVVTRDGMALLDITFGPFVVVNVAIAYVFLTVGTYWLVAAYWDARTSESMYTRQIGLVILAVLIPWVTNALTVFDLTLIDYSPFAFMLTGVLIATALFRYRLLDILPIARGTVVESMDNAVFVLDEDDQIVDVNPRARKRFAAEGPELIGRQFADVFESSPQIVEAATNATPTSEQLSVTNDGEPCYYEVTVSPIEDSFDSEIGRTVVFNDITVQVERQQDLDLMRQVLSRVLRHNMRNELQVVQGSTAILASDLDGQHEEIAEKAHTGAMDLVSLSNKARSIEELVEKDHTPADLDLVAVLKDAITDTQSEFPEVSFSAELPETCEVRIIPAIHLVFENLIENAAEHSSSTSRSAAGDAPENPAVDVALTRTDDQVTVTISDNGPGIPNHELTVLDNQAETDLEHGSGLGLWIVDWVIGDSTATVQFDTDTSGTDVTVTIPA